MNSFYDIQDCRVHSIGFGTDCLFFFALKLGFDFFQVFGVDVKLQAMLYFHAEHLIGIHLPGKFICFGIDEIIDLSQMDDQVIVAAVRIPADVKPQFFPQCQHISVLN